MRYMRICLHSTQNLIGQGIQTRLRNEFSLCFLAQHVLAPHCIIHMRLLINITILDTIIDIIEDQKI